MDKGLDKQSTKSNA